MPRNITYSFASFHTLSRPLKRSHCLAVWRETVEDYSSRPFIRHSDRFPALSGLASEIEQDLNGKYAAGLWTVDFLLGLYG